MNSLRIAGHRISQWAQNWQKGELKSLRGWVIWPRRYATVVAASRLEMRSPDSQGRAPADPFSDLVAGNQIMAKLSSSKLAPEEFYSGSLSGKQGQKIPNLATVSAELHHILSHIKVVITVSCKFRTFDRFIIFLRESSCKSQRGENKWLAKIFALLIYILHCDFGLLYKFPWVRLGLSDK